MIGIGLVLVIFVGDFGGVWTAFLGFFLLAAAEAELEVAAAREALAGLTVEHLMVPDPVVVPAQTTVKDFVERLFIAIRHTAYPVMSGRRLGSGGRGLRRRARLRTSAVLPRRFVLRHPVGRFALRSLRP
jgi:hypothetical protein